MEKQNKDKNRTDHPVMIIDGHNLFIRGFVVSPQMDSLGEPIGGVSTFLKTLRKLIEMHSPSHCMIAWDAGNGSSKRRALYSDYKGGNKARRLNRQIDDQMDKYKINQQNQLIRTIEYMKNMPVKQFFVEDCEADDVINQICMRIPEDKNIIIISADRDFYQLINHRINVYNPIKKLFITEEDCVNEFQATPQNVLIARSFLGDKSDNIDGVNGIGPKWIEKNLPMLREQDQIYLSDIKNVFEEHKDGKLKTWKKGYENFNIAERNFKLMHLGPGMMTKTQQEQVYEILENEDEGVYSLNKLTILKMLNKDGMIADFNFESWFRDFLSLLHMSKTEKLFN